MWAFVVVVLTVEVKKIWFSLNNSSFVKVCLVWGGLTSPSKSVICFVLCVLKGGNYFSLCVFKTSFNMITNLWATEVKTQPNKTNYLPLFFRHYGFIVSAAKLFATVYCVPFTEKVIHTITVLPSHNLDVHVQCWSDVQLPILSEN